jgi:hypothetical protein
MVYRAHIANISRDDVRRIMAALSRDPRYRSYRDWIPRDGLIGPSGLAVLEAIAAGRPIPDRVDVLMRADELNRRWLVALQNENVRGLFSGTPGVQFTLPPRVTEVAPEAPPPPSIGLDPQTVRQASLIRSLLRLGSGQDIPPIGEIINGINGVQGSGLKGLKERIEDMIKGLDDSFTVDAVNLRGLLTSMEQALGGSPQDADRALLRLREGDLLQRVEHLMQEGREGLLARGVRQILDLPASGTPLSAGEVQRRIEQLRRAVELEPGLRDFPDARQILMDRLQQASTDVQGATGERIAQIISGMTVQGSGLEGFSLLRNIRDALGGSFPSSVPPPPSPPYPNPAALGGDGAAIRQQALTFANNAPWQIEQPLSLPVGPGGSRIEVPWARGVEGDALSYLGIRHGGQSGSAFSSFVRPSTDGGPSSVEIIAANGVRYRMVNGQVTPVDPQAVQGARSALLPQPADFQEAAQQMNALIDSPIFQREMIRAGITHSFQSGRIVAESSPSVTPSPTPPLQQPKP